MCYSLVFSAYINMYMCAIIFLLPSSPKMSWPIFLLVISLLALLLYNLTNFFLILLSWAIINNLFSPSLDFVPSLRRLFSNSIFTMMILTYLVAVNGFIGMITFKPKFLEQVHGQSASKAIFLIGTAAVLRAHIWHNTMMLLKGSVIHGDKVDLEAQRLILSLLSLCPVENRVWPLFSIFMTYITCII